MEIKGKRIKKRYILVVLLVALIVPRCVQMNMDETALKEKLTAGGFENKYEMENIVASGFTTKAEFEKFIQTTPIPSIEGESAVQCAAIASFWEGRELSLKSDIGDLTPKSIRSVMNGDVIYDYVVGKTTNTILTARRDYLIKQLELKFEKAGVTEALKANYLECHTKFGPYVEKKCGSTGVCEESAELLGLDGKPLSGTSESEKSSSTASSGADPVRSSSDGGPLENLVEDYPRDKVLILVREDPIKTETCDLFKRGSGWHDQAICVNNQDDWKVLCMAAESVLKDLLEMPAKVAGTVGSSKNSEQSLLHVARNGGASFINTRWEANQWREWGQCGVQVNYSGMYEGSTINESLWAPVKGIVIEGNGSVVLTH